MYVPKGVHVDIPLQAYFRINTPNMGQFERTLIIATKVHTCIMWRGARRDLLDRLAARRDRRDHRGEERPRRYTTVQNWSNNVYNLVTQRAYVREGATMEWVDGNIGLEGHHEIPRLHPCRTLRQRLHDVAGFRRQGAVPGHRCEDDSLGPPYLFHHRREVHIARRWAFRLSRTCQDRRRARRVELQCGV